MSAVPVKPALRWANPFFAKKTVSLRVRNFDCDPLKVNDSSGNPIEIAAVVVWKVVDSAEAVFEVDDYISFCRNPVAKPRCETWQPHILTKRTDGEIALRSNQQQIADELKTEVQDRLEKAGVQVIEARISHLAYAPEIASAMLKRQQAQAIVAARRTNRRWRGRHGQDGAGRLQEQDMVDLDEERKAAMVSNLLVVLCGEENAQPVLNTRFVVQLRY